MQARPSILIQRCPTPCGELLLGTLYDRLCLCDWAERKDSTAVCARLCRELHASLREGRSPVHMQAETEIGEYFRGERRQFSIGLRMAGSAFQKAVWQKLIQLPYSTMQSYKDLARSLGCADKTRAVANAVAANALNLFVPCHRIVGKDGSLTGYAGGIEAKFFLLQLEQYYERRRLRQDF